MLFEHLAATDEQHIETQTRQAAVLASLQRVEKRYGAYVSKARNDQDRDARLGLLDGEMRAAVHEACLEHGYKDDTSVFNEVYARISGKPETGDSYTQETMTMPKANESGQGSGSSVDIDKSRIPKDGLKPIDVPSNQHPTEHQNIEQKAEYDADWINNGTPYRGDAPMKHNVDVEKPIGNTEAIPTKTFSDKGVNTNPVTGDNPLTNVSRTSKWHVIAEGQMPGQQVQELEQQMPQEPQTAGMDLDSLGAMVMDLAATFKQTQAEISEINQKLDGGQTPEPAQETPNPHEAPAGPEAQQQLF